MAKKPSNFYDNPRSPKKHPTFQLAVDDDEKAGYKLRKREDGRYVTEKEGED